MVRAENPRFFFEQSLNTFLVDVDANGDIDSRENVVNQVDLLILIHGSGENKSFNLQSKTDLKYHDFNIPYGYEITQKHA